MIAKTLQSAFAIMKGSEMVARSAEQLVAGDADVTGASIAPGVAITCRRARPAAAISVVDPGFVVDLVDWGTPDQPHNPDPPH